MNPKIYLAKPFDNTESFSVDETKFIHTMNLKTPENVFISASQNLNRAYERIPDGLPQYFYYNGVDMEYIYPLRDKILSLNSVIDFSIPILVPFRYAPVQASIMNFEKIIVPDENFLERLLTKNNGWAHLSKFFVFEKDSDEYKHILEYSLSDTPRHIHYYEPANRIINAIKSEDFKDLVPNLVRKS